MTAADLQTYRRRLEALVVRLGGDVARLRDDAGLAVAGESAPSDELTRTQDPGTVEAEEEIALGLLGNEEHLLAEAVAALERMNAGTFGRCEGCGKAIPRERLRAVPYARHCVACARTAEATPGP
jgi:RNA polymerase-binding transcription factor DksA